jgi:hypothetical protein
MRHVPVDVSGQNVNLFRQSERRELLHISRIWKTDLVVLGRA